MNRLKQKQFVSAVIYVHNAEDTIGEFLSVINNFMTGEFESYEIICVNDASTDGSKDSIRDFAKNCTQENKLSVVNMGYYHGIEAAMRAGIDLAIGDFVFEFDKTVRDYETNLIRQVFARCTEGYNVVSCGAKTSRLSSKLFYYAYNRNSGTQYALQSETFRIMSRRAINRISSMSADIPYRKALYSNCGLKADFIKYEPMNTNAKERQLKNPLDTAVTSLLLFSDIAYKVTISLTIFMMGILLIGVAYVIMLYILDVPVPGYTTIMLIIAGSFFALFTVLTIMIKYLSVILELVFRKQSYIIESIEDKFR